MTTSFGGTSKTGDTGPNQLVRYEYYDRKFLRYAIPRLAWYQFAQKRPLPQSSGTGITFTRYYPPGRQTTALTEGTNPTGQRLSSTIVSADIREWGGVFPISSKLDLTAIDPKVSEASALCGIQGGETLDWVIQIDTLSNSSVTANSIFASGNWASGSVIDSTLTTDHMRKAVYYLKIAKAIKFEGNYWVCIISPNAEFDLTGDTTWETASEYAGSRQMYEGEIGKWFGTRFVEDTAPLTTPANSTSSANVFPLCNATDIVGSTGAVHPTVVFGQEAFGVSELTGRKIIIKEGGPQDTSNPLNMWKTVSWKQTFANVVLNPTWIRPIWSAPSI